MRGLPYASRAVRRTALGSSIPLLGAFAAGALFPPEGLAQGTFLAELEERVFPEDADGGDQFGFSVDLYGDTFVGGAWHESSQLGAAYVFRRSGEDWIQEQKLTASDGTFQDWFGTAVAIDGDRVLVGARGADALGPESGAAYLYERSGGQWLEVAKLLPTNGAGVEYYGNRVALEGDTAVVASTHADLAGHDSGAVYVFTWDGTAWTEEAVLTAPDAQPAALFGSALEVEGNRIAVGAFLHTVGGIRPGAAYLYSRTGGVWSLEQQLAAGAATDDDDLGGSIALRYPHLAVGAPRGGFSGGFSPGCVYMYRHEAGSWVEVAKLEGSDQDAHDEFGKSVSLSGERLLVGAPLSSPLGFVTGSVHLFEYDRRDWNEVLYLYEGVGSGDRYGNSLEMDGDGAAVGAYRENAPNMGGSVGGVVLVTRILEAVRIFCSGDGSAAPCPCDHEGAPDHGCANGSFASGALLAGLGSTGVGTDDFVLGVSASTPGRIGMFGQGDLAVAGGMGLSFGDGLRCTGGGVLRLELAVADGTGAVASRSIASAGGVEAGQERYYQWWYRDGGLGRCGSGFNLSNGLRVLWAP